MEHAILYAIIPIAVAMLAGYIGGRRGTFDAAAAGVLNRLVLNIALPAALFASIVRADRDPYWTISARRWWHWWV